MASVRFQVEHVGQIRREDVLGDQVGVLTVRGDHDVADRRIIRWHRIANEQHRRLRDRYRGVRYRHDAASFVSWWLTAKGTTQPGRMFTPRVKGLLRSLRAGELALEFSGPR